MLVELPEHAGDVKVCLYSADGRFLVTGCNSGRVLVWNGQSPQYGMLHSLPGHVSPIKDVKFSPATRYLATVAVEMSLRIWDVESDFCLKSVYYAPVNKMDFTSEDVMVTGESTGNLRYLKIDE